MKFIQYIANMWSASSQLLNTLIGGNPNESLCGRAYREDWTTFMKIMNFIMFFNKGQHCRGAYNQDRDWAIKAAQWPERVAGSEESMS